MTLPSSFKEGIDRDLMLRFGKYLVREYQAKSCQKEAAALTYMTLFAVVPLMTVVFTMFSLFPAFSGVEQQLQQFMFEHLMPDSGLEIKSYLEEFTQQARSLTLAGVLLLICTAFFMIKNIEGTFNGIWGVEDDRKGLPSFLLYWAVLSLGPLLLGVGFAMSTYVLSLQLFADGAEIAGISVLFSAFPWLLTAIAMTLLFAAIPNCHVPFKHAIIGGVLATIFFELIKDLFGAIIRHTTFTAIYGAFAIVPLFLIWIYILWVIVLAGGLLTRCLSSFQKDSAVNSYSDLLAALLALAQFKAQNWEGKSVGTSQLLGVGVEPNQWHRLREVFTSNNLITVTHQDDFVLCRDLRTVTLGQLAHMLGGDSELDGADDHLRQQAWFDGVESRLRQVEETRNSALDVSLHELLDVTGDSPAVSAPPELPAPKPSSPSSENSVASNLRKAFR